MSFYEGTKLSIQWSATNGCGNPKLLCSIVIQYMCGTTDANLLERVRDGTDYGRVSDDENGGNSPFAIDGFLGVPEFGMHESLQFYKDCKTRHRNGGLWLADRAIYNSMTGTRQNQVGNRHGLECPEERDYYPFWHPTPWRDVAVLTDDPSLCTDYTTLTENVLGRWHCVNLTASPIAGCEANNAVDCQSPCTWRQEAAHGIPPPECRATEFSEPNSGAIHTYMWTLPTVAQESCISSDNCACVLRLRYNISQLASGQNAQLAANGLDYTKDDPLSPVTTDPFVSIGLPPSSLRLTLDTSATGRTFQDRSHVFKIRPRGLLAGVAVHNLNVRGRRGTRNQVFPALQYDFVPSALHVRVGDHIHFQWTGSDWNPPGFFGAGAPWSDRSNIVQFPSASSEVPASDAWLATNDRLFPDLATRRLMANLNQTLCPTYGALMANNNFNVRAYEMDPENCLLLNKASPYFDGGVVPMNTPGTFYYGSTRSSGFGVGSQKGVIVVGSSCSGVAGSLGCECIGAGRACNRGLICNVNSAHCESLSGADQAQSLSSLWSSTRGTEESVHSRAAVLEPHTAITVASTLISLLAVILPHRGSTANWLAFLALLSIVTSLDLVVVGSNAEVYLHNPSGSNNRISESTSSPANNLR
jgi:hypothetical protein